MTAIVNPFPLLTNASGALLENGRVWIGQPNDDPETSPKPVFWDAERTIPAAQPLETSYGYIVRSGTPANVYVDGAHSIRVRTAAGVSVFYAPLVKEDIGAFSAIAFDSVAALLADNRLSYSEVLEGAKIRAADFIYTVAAPAASDYQVMTAAGLRLYVSSTPIRPEQFYPAPASPTDELAQLQKVLDFAAGRGPIHLSRPHYIRPVLGNEALFISSDTTLVFETGARIENLAHNLDRYEMLMISDVENVRVVNPVLDGRRDLNAATTGEYGNGIQILGACKSIEIVNPVTNNMWGDGIFIGQQLFAAPYAVPEDVRVVNHSANNCRRQGMSIAGGVRVTVDGPRWTNTIGTDPACGLDIEPDRADSKLLAIRILNPYTSGNRGGGIMIYLAALRANSTPVDITIQNHVSEDDYVVGFRCWRTGAANDNPKGAVRYLNPRAVRSAFSGIGIEDWDARGPAVLIDTPEIVDPNAANSSNPVHRAGIVAIAGYESVDQAVNIGNITIKNPSVTDSRTPSRIDRYIFVRNLKGVGRAEKVKVIDPVTLAASSPMAHWFDALGSFTDAMEAGRLPVATSTEVGVNSYAPVYTTAGASGDISIDLSPAYPAGAPDMTFAAEGTQFILKPDAGSAILPGGGLGKTLTVAVNGRVRLRRKSPTAWVIVGSSGALTFQP